MPAAPPRAGSPIVWHFGVVGDAAEVSRLLAAVRSDEICNLALFSRPRDAIEQPVASSGSRHCLLVLDCECGAAHLANC
jgi:hypothetical protein